MYLNGVGRIIQYFNPYPDQLINFDIPDQNYVWSLFEGQISNGIAHEFARIIYGDTGKSYCGFYNLGSKEGLGIQKEANGTIQAQGIWKGNESVYRFMEVTNF